MITTEYDYSLPVTQTELV